FDHRKPWVTHTFIQNPDVKRTQEWLDAYGKPVVNDEPEYEGDILQSLGNLNAHELVHRFWITMIEIRSHVAIMDGAQVLVWVV
ncbi:hypothetical protein ACC687_40220, partial [Rhizobium ruizarguesonis]